MQYKGIKRECDNRDWVGGGVPLSWFDVLRREAQLHRLHTGMAHKTSSAVDTKVLHPEWMWVRCKAREQQASSLFHFPKCGS
jgi:hypothetical protein